MAPISIKRGAISGELREKRFAIFEDKLKQTIDRDEFKEFLKCIVAAGYCDRSLIGSKTNIIFAYAFYLIGKYEYKLNASQLQKIISKAIFFFSLTSRYVGSFESQMEQDILNLPDKKTPEAFQNYFDNMAKSVLTDDFFKVTLIGMDGLETSSSRSPAFLPILPPRTFFRPMFYYLSQAFKRPPFMQNGRREEENQRSAIISSRRLIYER